MVSGMDAYHIVLYLTMEIFRIAVLLQNSTITVEAHHRHTEELEQFTAVRSQQVLSPETTTNIIAGKFSQFLTQLRTIVCNLVN